MLSLCTTSFMNGPLLNFDCGTPQTYFQYAKVGLAHKTDARNRFYLPLIVPSLLSIGTILKT